MSCVAQRRRHEILVHLEDILGWSAAWVGKERCRRWGACTEWIRSGESHGGGSLWHDVDPELYLRQQWSQVGYLHRESVGASTTQEATARYKTREKERHMWWAGDFCNKKYTYIYIAIVFSSLFESYLFSELPCSNLCFNKTCPFGVFVLLHCRRDGTVLLHDWWILDLKYIWCSLLSRLPPVSVL